MDKFVVDTMGIVLFLEKRRMPSKAQRTIEDALNGQAHLFIPAMVMVEVGYLSGKSRIELMLDSLTDFVQRNQHIAITPLDIDVIKSAFTITDIPELHDRLIAGTARMMNCQLITNDPKIEASAFVKAIWK